MRIVDDDVSWTCISTTKPEKEEEDDGDLPVVCIFWGWEDFGMHASQYWCPVQGRFVRGKVEGREQVMLSKNCFTIIFFDDAYTLSSA